MSKNNPKTCPLNSNFAFAIIALLAIGLLLYTTVEVFNCKQDIVQINERIQNSPSLVSAHDEQKIEKHGKDEKNNIVNDEKIEKETLIQSDPGIVYNSDGTIDTSKWTLYKNEDCGFEVLIPDFLELGESSGIKSNKGYSKDENYIINIIRPNLKELLVNNKNIHVFSHIKISGTSWDDEIRNNFKEVKLGNNKKGFIYKSEHYGNEGYYRYLAGSYVTVAFRDKGYVSLWTSNGLSSNYKKDPKMKLLFDTILASFDYY